MGGARYFFRNETSPQNAIATGQLPIDGHRYYFNTSTNSNERGKLITGWIKDGSNVYYARIATGIPNTGPYGSLVMNTTQTINGKSRTFNASGQCSTATRPTVHHAAIRYDDPAVSKYSQSQMEAMFMLATGNVGISSTSGFIGEFDIIFTLHSGIRHDVALNGTCPNFPNISWTCNRLNSTDCGDNRDCNKAGTAGHHKSGGRLLNLIPETNTNIIRLVGHRICYYDSGTSYHSTGGTMGLADFPGKNSIVSTQASEFQAFIQHELSHNLGARDDTCIGGDCVVNNNKPFNANLNSWCSDCKSKINANK